jgi:hypothetical protein
MFPHQTKLTLQLILSLPLDAHAPDGDRIERALIIC